MKSLQELLKEIKARLLEQMKAEGVTSFKHAAGSVISVTRWSVKNPATPEDKKDFFDFLKRIGSFEDLVGVNHQTLNAWYKNEMEGAKIRGEFDFKIPGIGEPTAFEDITFRKG